MTGVPAYRVRPGAVFTDRKGERWRVRYILQGVLECVHADDPTRRRLAGKELVTVDEKDIAPPKSNVDRCYDVMRRQAQGEHNAK